MKDKIRNLIKKIMSIFKIKNIIIFESNADYSDNSRDIADPWYTGDFESTYRDVVEGCEGFLAYLEKNEKI